MHATYGNKTPSKKQTDCKKAITKEFESTIISLEEKTKATSYLQQPTARIDKLISEFGQLRCS